MITEVYIEGKRFKLDPSHSLGKGGEADVYDLGDGRAVKVFKSPDHPDFQSSPSEQRAAEERIACHQRKLHAFPTSLPAAVVAPSALATDRSGRSILGYAMARVAQAEPLLRYADPIFRRAVSSARVVAIFRHLLDAVRALHAANVIIGDFNDLNVLVTTDDQPRVIDADSFQFGAFLCAVFTERFVDPRLCDASASAPKLKKPYDRAADWYAFNALLFQSLLYVAPYGGVHRPSDAQKRIPHGQRPLCRITVFDRDVRYPKHARAYHTFPDELLHHFHGVFERDERGPFPLALLHGLVFATCPHCGAEHARTLCPLCTRTTTSTSTEAPRQEARVIGTERLFETNGVVVHASMERGELRVVYFADGAYRRENGEPILRGNLDANVRFRILGSQTLIGRAGELLAIDGTAPPLRLAVDRDGNDAAFDTNAQHRYRITDGRLVRDTPSVWDPSAFAVLGDVLANQTRFWVGPTFGLGFYRAGHMSRVFLFDTASSHVRGINDDIRVPPIAGEILEMTATLDETRAWLFVAQKHAGRTQHLCFVYARTGQLEASAAGEPGDGSWLSRLRGKCATSGMLLSATDAGVVRVEVQAGTLAVTRNFPETEPFLDETCSLLIGRRGLCVVRSNLVLALQLQQP